MKRFDELASQEMIEKTKNALEANGMRVKVVENGDEARELVLNMIPDQATVMTATSQTSKEIGLDTSIDESDHFVSLRKKITSLPSHEQRVEARRINSAPDVVVGSVHAITEDGRVLVASNTGSQLPSYAYLAEMVIWIVGTQKIVVNLDEAFRRLHEYVFPLESARLQKLYGTPSNISKTLVVNREVNPERITIILIKEKLGF